MKKLYARFCTTLLILVLFFTYGASQKSILFVGRDNIGDWQSDRDLYDSLEAWGYAPEYWESPEFQEGVGLDYSFYDGAFFSETVDSKNMARFGTTDDYPLPCVNMEGWTAVETNDRWAWLSDYTTELFQTADAGGTEDDKTIIIQDNSHYITEIFNVGDQITWSGATDATDIADNRPVSIKEVNITYSNKLAVAKSHSSMADFWTMLTVDEMGASKNKMFYWGVNNTGLNGSDNVATDKSLGTTEFFQIVKRACEWAFDDAGSSTSVNEHRDLDGFALVTYPNPASDRVTIRFKSNGPSSARATLYNISGQQVGKFQQSTVPGNNFIYLNADEYGAGVYYLRLEMNGDTEYAKIVIQ